MGTSELDLALDFGPCKIKPSYVTLGELHNFAKLWCPQLKMGKVITHSLSRVL